MINLESSSITKPCSIQVSTILKCRSFSSLIESILGAHGRRDKEPFLLTNTSSGLWEGHHATLVASVIPPVFAQLAKSACHGSAICAVRKPGLTAIGPV